MLSRSGNCSLHAVTPRHNAARGTFARIAPLAEEHVKIRYATRNKGAPPAAIGSLGSRRALHLHLFDIGRAFLRGEAAAHIVTASVISAYACQGRAKQSTYHSSSFSFSAW